MVDAWQDRSRASARTDVVAPRRPGTFPPPTGRRRPDLAPPTAAPPDRSTESLLDRYPVTPMLVVHHERIVTGQTAEALWEVYHESVAPLTELAVLHHLDTREVVLGQLANPRILKLVARADGEVLGLGMVTNSLEDVPEISPAFLRARFPEHAARDAIYVGMLVLVAPGARGLTVFNRISTEMWQVPARVGGVLVFDVCEFNRTTFAAEELARRVAEGFPRSSVDVLDRQTWYVAHLPEPLPDPPSR